MYQKQIIPKITPLAVVCMLQVSAKVGLTLAPPLDNLGEITGSWE